MAVAASATELHPRQLLAHLGFLALTIPTRWRRLLCLARLLALQRPRLVSPLLLVVVVVGVAEVLLCQLVAQLGALALLASRIPTGTHLGFIASLGPMTPTRTMLPAPELPPYQLVAPTRTHLGSIALLGSMIPTRTMLPAPELPPYQLATPTRTHLGSIALLGSMIPTRTALPAPELPPYQLVAHLGSMASLGLMIRTRRTIPAPELLPYQFVAHLRLVALQGSILPTRTSRPPPELLLYLFLARLGFVALLGLMIRTRRLLSPELPPYQLVAHLRLLASQGSMIPTRTSLPSPELLLYLFASLGSMIRTRIWAPLARCFALLVSKILMGLTITTSWAPTTLTWVLGGLVLQRRKLGSFSPPKSMRAVARLWFGTVAMVGCNAAASRAKGHTSACSIDTPAPLSGLCAGRSLQMR